MLLPTYLDLKTHGETFTNIVNLKTEDSWYLDFFAKNLVGSFDTTKFAFIPMISVGLVPLILALLFFTLKSIKPIVKLSYSLFFTLIISSFYFTATKSFFLARNACSEYVFISLCMGYFNRYHLPQLLKLLYVWDQINLKHFTLVISFLFIGFLSTYFKNHYDFLVDVNFLLTLEFLIAYFILFIVILGYKSSYKWITSTIVIFRLFRSRN